MTSNPITAAQTGTVKVVLITTSPSKGSPAAVAAERSEAERIVAPHDRQPRDGEIMFPFCS
jgi:hypothetical protein